MIVLAALSMLNAAVQAPPATAQDSDHEPPQTAQPAGPPGSVAIGDGIFLTEGVVHSPNGGPERALDAYDTAVFVQSWLASAFFGGQDIAQEPPPDLPVHRVDATGDWAGNPGTVTVYYATDGTTPYIAFPGMVVWSDPTQAPPPSNWFVAPQRTIAAFDGTAELVPTLGVETATSSPGDPDGEEAADRNDQDLGTSTRDSAEWWPWVAVGVLALAIAGASLWLRRRARSAGEAVV